MTGLDIEITGSLAASPRTGETEKGPWVQLRLTVPRKPYLYDGKVVDGSTSTYTIWANGPLVGEVQDARLILGDWVTVQVKDLHPKVRLDAARRPLPYVEFTAEAFEFPKREEVAALLAAQREEVAALLPVEGEPRP